MDEFLRRGERLARVSPDDEAGAVALDHHRGRAGLSTRPSLRLALLNCLRQYLKKRPLDFMVELDPDTPLSAIQVILNGLQHTLGPQGDLDLDIAPDGRHARIFGRAFELGAEDELQVCCNGPLGVKRRDYVIFDPRIIYAVRVARRVCNDCDEEVDQHDDCLCTIGLSPPCPSCNGSGYDFGTAHHNVPDPCRDCGGACTIGAYNRTTDERLRD